MADLPTREECLRRAHHMLTRDTRGQQAIYDAQEAQAWAALAAALPAEPVTVEPSPEGARGWAASVFGMMLDRAVVSVRPGRTTISLGDIGEIPVPEWAEHDTIPAIWRSLRGAPALEGVDVEGLAAVLDAVSEWVRAPLDVDNSHTEALGVAIGEAMPVGADPDAWLRTQAAYLRALGGAS